MGILFSPPDENPKAEIRRCAIYTRKSREQGLEREFNSLESQRAVCSAYITSQGHRGWTELARHYDDGGISGATLERPQIQQLLADMESGAVDVVVVYRLDRITRSLFDFIRLVEAFGRYGVLLVSITENFDTSNSIGRLILNVLLTFAQFERELAGDRVRDKVHAIKSSGRWAGGPAPFGYSLVRRRLHMIPEQAEYVRHLFSRYAELKNLTALANECRKDGIMSELRRISSGAVSSPNAASLSHILRNPVYIGFVRHGDELFQGLHAPILDRKLFDEVQRVREAQSRARAYRNENHILTDILFDGFGRPMSVSTPLKPPSAKYSTRLYMSRQSSWGREQNLKRLRADADELEQLVLTSVELFLSDRARLRSMLFSMGRYGEKLDRLPKKGDRAARHLANVSSERLWTVLHALIVRIEVSMERVKIVLRSSEVERFLEWDAIGVYQSHRPDWARSQSELIDVPACAIRYHDRFSLPIERRPETACSQPSKRLYRLIRQARHYQQLVDDNRTKSIAELALQVRTTTARFGRILRLNYLAPDIVTSILDGTQPAGLTRRQLVMANLPMDWALQRSLLGFPERTSLI